MNHDIRLKIEGSLLERLLEQALKKGAEFASVRRYSKRGIIVSADGRSAQILTALCEKYSLDCRELKRGGRSALAGIIRRRWTLAPGIIVCALICTLFLSRIWMVDVEFTGPRADLGSRNEILSLLDGYGVKAGMPAGRINAALLQKQLAADTGNYSFIGVRRQGIRLLVEASPEVPSPDVHVSSDARDLVAGRSGVVESIRVYSGEAAVKPGDTVLQGSLLIRGAETTGKNSETGEEITVPVGALGEVIARCWYEGSASGDINTIQHVRSGASETACRLKLMDFSLPLTESEGYSSEEIETETLPVVGLFLPLEIERNTHYETTPVSRSADAALLEKQLSTLAMADARSAIAADELQYETASAWTDTARDANTLHVRAVYEIYTDIAVERDAPD